LNSWVFEQKLHANTGNHYSPISKAHTNVVAPNIIPTHPVTQMNPTTRVSKVTAGPISVACVFTTGGLGDKSFNDMVFAGLQKAHSDLLCDFVFAVPDNDSDYLRWLNDTYATAGSYDLIIAVGFRQIWSVNETAKSYPNQAILLIDAIVSQGNVSSVIFRENEGSFLVGAMAGLMTQTGKIGFIGGQDVPLIRRFWAGYKAGALYEKNRSFIEVIEDFVGLPGDPNAWNDPATAKAIAEDMWAQGVDIIYAAAGGSGNGAHESANEQGPGFYSIGVDADQDYLYPGSILTSMMKRVDVAVYNGILDVYNSNWSPEVKNLGLAENGVGISNLTYTSSVIGPTIIQEVNVTVRNKIISGELNVPNTSFSLCQWIADMGIFINRGSISIFSDSQFTSQGFPGTGTINDPYWIVGFNITDPSGTLISVSGTTDYFRITNCILNGMSTPGSGISFTNVMHGTIENNKILKNNDGIVFTYSHENVIHNNSVSDSVYVGIRIGIGGTTGNNYYNNISMNTVFDNSEAGIGIYSNNHHNNIFKNTVFNNGAGIGFQSNSTNNNIQENLLYNNGVGLYFSSSNSNTIRFNDFSGNTAADYSLNNVFEKNYWSDWTGTGSYSFEGNDDSSPLTNPYHLTPPSITAPTSATTTLMDSVTIQWTTSTDLFGHSITYSVSYSTDDGTTWIALISGLTTTNYVWDLTNIKHGLIVLLKVHATDEVGFISYSISASSFTIDNPTSAPTTPTTTTTTKITPAWTIHLVLLSFFLILPLKWIKREKYT
jgi:basic membrane protein A